MALLRHILQIILYACLTMNIVACSNTVEYTPPEGSTEMAITYYSFGKMTIDGTDYTGDLTILPGGKIRPWSFDYGSHGIVPDDFKALITDEVKTLVIGTGYDGAASLKKEGKEAIEQIKAKGIEVHVMPTSDAVELFNASPKTGMLVCFHLNC